MDIKDMKGLYKWLKGVDDHAAHLKQHYTCYRDLGKYKIYVSAGYKPFYGKKQSSSYYLLDVKANQAYEISTGHYGSIQGFLNVLQGKGNDIPPLKILELARILVKRYVADSAKMDDPQRQLLINFTIGQLDALEKLAEMTHNPEIVKDINDLWPPKR